MARPVGGPACVHACMHVCALICERPSIALGERVQRESTARVYVRALCVVGFLFFCCCRRAILHNSLLSEQLSELPSGSINPPSIRSPERPSSYMDALTQPSDAVASDSLWLHFLTLLLTGGVA